MLTIDKIFHASLVLKEIIRPFMISLLPMLLNQYGGRKGVQEITGLINLLNPSGLAAAVTYLVGVCTSSTVTLLPSENFALGSR